MSSANSTPPVEVWKPVPGWEGLYEISNLGNVRSARFRNGSYPGRPVKKSRKRNGYLQVCLCRSGKESHRGVHRLVALTFLPPPGPGQTHTNHKNGDKTDNRAENLEWATSRENVRHAMNILGHCHHGEAAGMAKLTEEKVRRIRSLHQQGYSYSQIARAISISRITVRDIVKRRTWTHI